MPMVSALYNVDIGVVAVTWLRLRIRRWVALAQLSFVPSRFLGEEVSSIIVARGYVASIEQTRL